MGKHTINIAAQHLSLSLLKFRKILLKGDEFPLSASCEIKNIEGKNDIFLSTVIT